MQLNCTAEWKGVTYYGRYVDIGKDRNPDEPVVLMFEDSLRKVIQEMNTAYVNEKDLVALDELIYCFVPKHILTQSDKKVIRWCDENGVDL